jgi:uncharacterized protein (TIGR02266 family)
MGEERRKARRGRVPGLRVEYEDAAGGKVEAEALDVCSGGAFILTPAPLAPGKRLSLDVALDGETTRWSALARVVWTRPSGSPGGPPGMGVKIIDADDAMIALIERLVDSGERTDPGTGGTKIPARERTMLGIGMAEKKEEAVARPIVGLAPTREKTILGMGMVAGLPPVNVGETAPPASASPETPQVPPAPDSDESLALDLVAKKPHVAVTEAAKEPELVPKEPESSPPITEDSLSAAGLPRRRGRTWLVLLLLLAIAGGAVYVYRDRIPWQRLRSYIGTLRSKLH